MTNTIGNIAATMSSQLGNVSEDVAGATQYILELAGGVKTENVTDGDQMNALGKNCVDIQRVANQLFDNKGHIDVTA